MSFKSSHQVKRRCMYVKLYIYISLTLFVVYDVQQKYLWIEDFDHIQ